MNLKNILTMLVFIALAQGVLAQETLNPKAYERSLQEMGYESFSLEIPESVKCVDYNFIIPSEFDLNSKTEKLFPVFSLNFDFLPVRESRASIDIRLNDFNVSTVTLKNSKCSETECIARVFMQYDEIIANGKNKLTVCPKTSSSTSGILIKNTSIIGLYKTPVFKKEDFTVTPIGPEFLTGKEISIKISIKNSGSLESKVDLNYIKPIAEEKTEIKSFKVLKGETRWSGIINAGETKELEYVIKPEGAVFATMPAAIACFENVFSEKECIVSNYPQLRIVEPETKISGTILAESEIAKTGENAKLKIAVTNHSSQAMSNIAVYLNAPKQLTVETESQIIPSIQPNETKYLEYNVLSKNSGTFSIDCQIVYQEETAKNVSCNEVKIVFEGQKIPTELIAIAALVLASIAIYLYINHSGKP